MKLILEAAQCNKNYFLIKLDMTLCYIKVPVYRTNYEIPFCVTFSSAFFPYSILLSTLSSRPPLWSSG
jgi:hypothetical protein